MTSPPTRSVVHTPNLPARSTSHTRRATPAPIAAVDADTGPLRAGSQPSVGLGRIHPAEGAPDEAGAVGVTGAQPVAGAMINAKDTTPRDRSRDQRARGADCATDPVGP